MSGQMLRDLAAKLRGDLPVDVGADVETNLSRAVKALLAALRRHTALALLCAQLAQHRTVRRPQLVRRVEPLRRAHPRAQQIQIRVRRGREVLGLLVARLQPLHGLAAGEPSGQ